jgi:hypothetical protein
MFRVNTLSLTRRKRQLERVDTLSFEGKDN